MILPTRSLAKNFSRLRSTNTKTGNFSVEHVTCDFYFDFFFFCDRREFWRLFNSLQNSSSVTSSSADASNVRRRGPSSVNMKASQKHLTESSRPAAGAESMAGRRHLAGASSNQPPQSLQLSSSQQQSVSSALCTNTVTVNSPAVTTEKSRCSVGKKQNGSSSSSRKGLSARPPAKKRKRIATVLATSIQNHPSTVLDLGKLSQR
jgi:hypothetical protein